MRPRLLDLYSCSGGAGRGYQRAGFHVTGVDHVEPSMYAGDEFIRDDAIAFLACRGREFDAIHASPPCQASSALTKGNRRRAGWEDGHFDLIPITRALLDHIGRPYVIENVQGAALRRDLTLCGLMFGLRVFRHRYFELGGWVATAIPHPSHRGHRVAGWRHGVRYDGDMVAPYGDGGGKGTPAEWAAAMGIDWTLDKHELREAIPPLYAEFVGTQLFDLLASSQGRAAA